MKNLSQSSTFDSPEDEIKSINEEIDRVKTERGVKALELLEKAASLSLERRYGAGREARAFYDQAMKLPFPCDCTLIANAVFTQIVAALKYESDECFLQGVFDRFHSRLIPGSSICHTTHELNHGAEPELLTIQAQGVRHRLNQTQAIDFLPLSKPSVTAITSHLTPPLSLSI